MRLLITLDPAKRVSVVKYFSEIELEKTAEDGTLVITALIEPHDYREIDQALKDAQGKIEVLAHSVKPDSDRKFEEEDD